MRLNAVEPAQVLGWVPIVFADLLCPQRHRVKLQAALKREFASRKLVADQTHDQTLAMVPTPTMRISDPSSRRSTQVESILRTLGWATRTAELMGGQPRLWSALLLSRADLEIKAPLNLPRPRASPLDRAILVPFQCSDQPFTMRGRPTVADALHFVPRARLGALLAALRSLRQAGNLHSLCDWIHHVHYFVPSRHNANSEKEWNPIYRIVGRNEGAPSVHHLVGSMKGLPEAVGRPCV